MMAIKKILVGIDFSEHSKTVLERAVFLAKKWDASICVLHVLSDLPYDGAGSSTAIVEMMGQLEKEAEDALTKLVREVASDSVEIEIELREGALDHEILLFAEKIRADLLMVGAESKKGLEGIFLGHTAESVVEKSLIPVWVEGRKASEEISQILVPTDLSENSRNAVSKSIEWARKLNARLLFQHVMEAHYIPSFSLIDPHDYEEKMGEIAKSHFEEFLKKLPLQNIQYDTHLSQGAPATEIAKLAQKNKVGLIMLSTHGRTGLGYRLLGTVAKKVLRHTPCNVLLVRPDTIDFSWLKKEILAVK